MARLQILELPEGSNDDQPPFVLVVDQYQPQRYVLGPDDDQAQPLDIFGGVAEKIGARAVLVFEDTIDIPANDTSASLPENGGTEPEFVLNVGDQDINAIAAEAVRRNPHGHA